MKEKLTRETLELLGFEYHAHTGMWTNGKMSFTFADGKVFYFAIEVDNLDDFELLYRLATKEELTLEEKSDARTTAPLEKTPNKKA